MDLINKHDCWVYDIETYLDYFCMVADNLATGDQWIFEISTRRNDAAWMFWFLAELERNNAWMIGFNSVGFDYPVIHHFMTHSDHSLGQYPDAFQLFQKAQAIIDSPRNDWTHSVPEWERKIRQIDIFLVKHWNNFARSVSLKKLEVFMRSPNVEDLPLEPGSNVPLDMMDPMIKYCCWDVSETAKAALLFWHEVEFRLQLDRDLGGKRSRINWSDVKIGSEYLLDRLRESGVKTHVGRSAIQTPRHEGIQISDILLNVEFDSLDLRRIYQFFQQAFLLPSQTKGFFDNLSATINGFTMTFGTGGLHGAVPSTTFRATSDTIIQLRDVVSYYPRICVVNNWYPKHLGPEFVRVYDELFWERKKYGKGTPLNLLYKLGLNGSFGKLGDKWSALHDPQIMMAITINGQLLLARLTEVLMRIPSLTMIQVNTDGVAYICDKADEKVADDICAWWENWTGLSLGIENYSVFAQRDVNNYLAIEA